MLRLFILHSQSAHENKVCLFSVFCPTVNNQLPQCLHHSDACDVLTNAVNRRLGQIVEQDIGIPNTLKATLMDESPKHEF